MNIYIWGYGSYGQLGFGDTSDRLEPTLLDTNDHDKLEWIQIACGVFHTVGLTKNGEVFTWGSNYYGQLGHGDKEDRRVPTKVADLDGLLITKISCYQNHTAALTDKGEILTWGQGALGHGNRFHQLKPKKVEALAGKVIVDMACGGHHTSVVTSTGSIFTWGHGIGTGHGENVVLLPRLLSSKGFVSVSANYDHTACVTKIGEVFTWGNGDYGKLGHSRRENQQTPKRVEALIGVKAKLVSCGGSHTAVCTEDGHVYTFGRGMYGNLGHGDKENKYSPVLLQALEGKHIIEVQCGERHTMALTSSGYVFTCRSAEDGVLGHGSVKLKCFSFPCLVEGLREHNVVQISSGSLHCVVLVDPTSPSSIRQSQQTSVNNQELSDVVLIAENQSLYAQIDVLRLNSDYFAAMFRSNMRESVERVVQVPNCSKAALLHVLEYLYLDDFTIRIDDVVELWDLADYYQLEGLKYSCMGTLERCLSKNNAPQILQEVEDLSCQCDELKRMCRMYL